MKFFACEHADSVLDPQRSLLLNDQDRDGGPNRARGRVERGLSGRDRAAASPEGKTFVEDGMVIPLGVTLRAQEGLTPPNGRQNTSLSHPPGTRG